MKETGAGSSDVCFFFSSRRRHTRCSRDWSSDVCSSDLRWRLGECRQRRHLRGDESGHGRAARRSEERRVGKSVDLGGRRIIKKKKKTRAAWARYTKRGGANSADDKTDTTSDSYRKVRRG